MNNIKSTVFVLFLFVAQLMTAQEIIPLSGNIILRGENIPTHKTQSNAALFGPTDNCPNYELGVDYIISGDSVFNSAQSLLDFSIDPDGVLDCANCGDLDYGSAYVIDSSGIVKYFSNTGVDAGRDSVIVRFCSEDLTTCYDTSIYYIQVNRMNETHMMPMVTLNPEEQTTLVADLSLLEGDLACNELVDCPNDNYEGRDQVAYFTTYSEPDNNIRYHASRFPGIDKVCVKLCDDNAICDTYEFQIEITGSNIDLPILEDFSDSETRTHLDLWLDTDVFVNTDMAIHPPSIGVATFDGINSKGNPYGGSYGKSDNLTSKGINFSGSATDYSLSYWLQPQGYADRPEIKDSMIVEFRDMDGEWNKVASHKGVPSNQPNTIEQPFTFHRIAIPEEYQYDGFQFRFTNYSDRRGQSDAWHLDYIRLDNNITDSLFSDIAFMELPNYVLSPYTSMPWGHFIGSDGSTLAQNLEVGIFNHFAETITANPSSVVIEETNSSTNMFGGNFSLLNTPQQIEIENGVAVNYDFPLNSFPTTASPVWTDYSNNMTTNNFHTFDVPTFETRYTLANTSQVVEVGYEQVQNNDEVTRTTVFDNYFAYDDGTAENAMITAEGNQIAVKFTAFADDELRGIRIHTPHFFNEESEDQLFKLKVWLGELTEVPDYEYTYETLFADAVLDTLQGFTTYPLLDNDGETTTLEIPEGDFYIGWEQVSNCDFIYCFAVGYDRNRPQGKDLIFRNSSGSWESLAETTPAGSLMLRAVVGDEFPIFTNTNEVNNSKQWSVYPNPVSDVLNITLGQNQQLENYEYQIIDAIGRVVLDGKLSPSIAVTQLIDGLYTLRLVNTQTGEYTYDKVIVTH